MYVVVQYGTEERLLNPNCRCLMLLDLLKRRIQAADDVELDVSDEKGNVKLLRENLDRYAAELFADRERLVLLKVDRKESGEFEYQPLVDNQNIVNESFIAQLSSRSNVTSPPKNAQRQKQVNGQQAKRVSNAGPKTVPPTTSAQRSLVTPEPKQTATFSTSGSGELIGRQTSANSSDGRAEKVSNNRNKSNKTR